MSYASHETSTESGRPVEVFEIVAGTSSFYYTSAEDEQTIGAQPYTPVEGLRPSNTIDGPEKREEDFELTFPASDPLGEIFKGTLPGYRVSLVMKRFHRDDLPTPEVAQVFDGYVQSAIFKKGGKEITLIARTELAAIGKQIPRRTFQSACNHVCYDATTCKADDTDPAFRASSLSVSSQVGAVLTVSSGLSGVYADGFMDGGFVEIVGGSDFRLIRSHTGNVLTLSLPFSTTPSLVHVFAGCGHDIATCKTKFDNVINYGGFAFIPKKNPYGSGVL